MPITNDLDLTKDPLDTGSPATLTVAHNVNMDLLSAKIGELITLVNTLESTQQGFANSTNLVRYTYTLLATQVDGTTETDADGTTITKSGTAYTLVHATDLTDAIVQIEDDLGRVLTQVTIDKDSANVNNVNVDVGFAITSDLKVIIVN